MFNSRIVKLEQLERTLEGGQNGYYTCNLWKQTSFVHNIVFLPKNKAQFGRLLGNPQELSDPD